MKTSIVCLVVIAVVLLFALSRRTNVKASVHLPGVGFSLEATEPR